FPAVVGGLMTLWLFNSTLSLYSVIGLFLLMGIVKKNGIMIVDFALHRLDEGYELREAIHEASIERFRPIIMTTLAALMGALPIAFGVGADGSSRRPLGLVIVGGLIVSQLLTLYITPVIYLWLEWFQEHVLDRVPFLRSGHFLKFVRHWLLVSRLATSSTREVEQAPGCDSLGYVARDWRGKEIHASPEAPFPVQQYALQPDAPNRCWRGASVDADQGCALPHGRARGAGLVRMVCPRNRQRLNPSRPDNWPFPRAP